MSQKKCNTDILIVGSGPTGVSAAFPLINAGLNVVMVDGGAHSESTLPSGNYTDIRNNYLNQNKIFLGNDFHAFRNLLFDNPKIRVPASSYVFSHFNKIFLYISSFISRAAPECSVNPSSSMNKISLTKSCKLFLNML